MTRDVSSGSNVLSKTTGAAKKKRSKVVHYDVFSEPYDAVQGERAMWVAVITQAMQDALSKSINPEAQYHKHEAICWLTGTSSDFVTVCHYAGFDPGYVRKRAKKALASPVAWRAEAGKGSRYQERKAYRKKVKEKSSAAAPVDNAMSVVLQGAWQ